MTGLLRGRLRVLMLVAFIALSSVLAVQAFALVEVVDSQVEVAAVIDAADFSVDAQVVSVEQSTPTDTLAVTAASYGIFDLTGDRPIPTLNSIGTGSPQLRLDELTFDRSPRLDRSGDGGLL